MAEEKIEKHETHEGAKTVTVKRSTLWGIGVFVLLVLLVASIFTGGFGIMKSGTGYATNTGNTGGTNTGNTGATTINPSAFSDSSLFPSLGPSNAKATVIELADFQCPYCALASGLPSWGVPTDPISKSIWGFSRLSRKSGTIGSAADKYNSYSSH